MTWATTILREFKGAADDIVYRVAKQFEGRAETTENVAKAARMAKRLQARKVANPPTKPLARAPRAQLPAEKPKPKAQMPKLKAQTAKPLALPKPGPGLPEGASKPKGGQFWPDYNSSWRDGGDGYLSPEAAAREARDNSGFGMASEGPVGDWLEKALAKYYKRDFGAPDDPLRDLAVRGLHYDPDMTPEKWKATVDSYLYEDPIGSYTVPDYWETRSAANTRKDLLEHAPWLAKQPVTDNLYGISGGLDLSHFTDEMLNALRPDQSGLPSDLAVDVSSLDRMSFPQAVERVGRINQWRAKQMEEAAAARLSSPAVQMYKEYPEAGMRWVELRQPEFGPLDPPEDWGWLPEGDNAWRTPQGGLMERDLGRNGGFTGEDGYWHHPATAGGTVNPDKTYEQLKEQLKFEGDTMGHCVGGYCDDVASGRSRIFSLRDAKGMPHVTVETGKPSYGRNWDGLRYDLPDDPRDEAWEAAMQALRDRGDDLLFDADGNLTPFGNAEHAREQDIWAHNWLSQSNPEEIIQIKGKQNRAPNAEYLPYVQDFVKSGQWGRVGDLRNTNLAQLPDKRYITYDQWDAGMRNALATMNPNSSPEDIERLLGTHRPNAGATFSDEDWANLMPYFEGYKRGGRVKAAMPVDLKVNTCGCGACA